jgi:putrescine aminotransferase
MVSGDGCVVTDDQGRGYLDARACSLNAALGYGHPEVTEAITHQAERLMTYDLAIGSTPPPILLAQRIAELTPGPLERTFFVNSGSEAAETAIKIARLKWKALTICSFSYLIRGPSARHGFLIVLTALVAALSAFRLRTRPHVRFLHHP